MKLFYFGLLLLCFESCKSPAELLENGSYNQAFDKAVKEVKKGKDIDQNITVIEKSVDIKVASALRYAVIKSQGGNVKDWINTQTKLYQALEEVGRANILLKGMINEPYDELCSVKKDIDYQIVEHYYDKGHDYLDDYYNQEQKVDARNAYFSFVECEKFEGQSFFPNLADDKEDAYQNGIVYYVSDYGNIGGRLFLEPLPRDAGFKPDCDISIDHGFVSFSTSENDDEDVQTKTIETGQESVTDTSGNTTYIPIMAKIEATIITKIITVTAQVTTQLRSTNITGQCFVSSSSFTTEISDTYEEVSVVGDERALNHPVETNSGEPAFYRDRLESEVIKKAEDNIGI
ncbi:MAG: hypothetical protein ACJA1A_000977 [Saprospiraceae bacterium]|jgi:hypothetical protein